MKEREVLMEIDLDFARLGEKKNKIREMFSLFDFEYPLTSRNKALIVTTDRISVFDVVMKNGIPLKGKVLNGISAFWFRQVEKANICPTHFITDNFDEFFSKFDYSLSREIKKKLQPHKEVLEGRSMLIWQAKVIPVECIVRQYLDGSAHASYQETGKVCGIELPKGLKKGDRLPAPVFTPSTKAPLGQHDANITFEHMSSIVGWQRAQLLRAYSLSLFCFASNILALKGIVLKDSKFEYGILDNRGLGGPEEVIILVDELLTPDCCRFEPELTKQPVRNYLESIGFDKKTPIALPSGVVERTCQDYVKIYEIITGQKLTL